MKGWPTCRGMSFLASNWPEITLNWYNPRNQSYLMSKTIAINTKLGTLIKYYNALSKETNFWWKDTKIIPKHIISCNKLTLRRWRSFFFLICMSLELRSCFNVLKGHKHLIFWKKKLNRVLAIVLSVNCLHQRETERKVKYIVFIIFKNKIYYHEIHTVVYVRMERIAIFFMQFINNVKT